MVGMILHRSPLRARLSFEDRAYTAGETVSVAVTVVAKRDCRVRRGKVELISDARHRDVFPSFKIEDGRFMLGNEVTVPVEPIEHQSLEFLSDTYLSAGSEHTVEAELELAPMASEGQANRRSITGRKWWVQATIDIEGGRDVNLRRELKFIS